MSIINNNIITTPVGISDISKVLGVASNDLGTLCKSSNVNKWSKKKPVGYNSLEPNRESDWWRGTTKIEDVSIAERTIGNYTCTGNVKWITTCGIKMLAFDSKVDVLKAFNPVGNAFTSSSGGTLTKNYSYVPPVGGASEPYRAGDFIYYWHGAGHNVIPDIETEGGTRFVNQNNPNSVKVKCSVMSAFVRDDIQSELSFADLYGGLEYPGFTVITGVMNGNTFDIIGLDVYSSQSTDLFKEVTVNLSSSLATNQTIIAVYCAYGKIDGVTYYIPIYQSSSYRPNTITAGNGYEKRKCVKSWHVEKSIPWSAITFMHKQNYGSSFSWISGSSKSWSFNTSGTMNRLYLKIAMPRKSSTYGVNESMFKIEVAGYIKDYRGSMNMGYYSITSQDTKFVTRASEVTSGYDWSPTESITITSGTGTQDVFLAIYDFFGNHGGVNAVYGGQIWQIALYFKNGQSEFSSAPDVVYGGFDERERLNINFDAIS